MLQHLAMMVLFALLVDLIAVREELRFVTRTSGVQSVIIPGTSMMLKLSVLNLDSLAIVILINYTAASYLSPS